MTKFFVLSVPTVEQYKYAWFETTDSARYSEDAPRCPTCLRDVGGHYWLPPFEVKIKQPRTVGDFVGGFGGCHLLLSNHALKIVRSIDAESIIKEYPIRVVKMGTTKKSQERSIPILTGVLFRKSATRVLFDRMGTIWQTKPSPTYCPTCGPGGGDDINGTWVSIKRIVINELSWSGEQLFLPMNLHGSFIISDTMRAAFQSSALTNFDAIPIEHYSKDYRTLRMPA